MQKPDQFKVASYGLVLLMLLLLSLLAITSGTRNNLNSLYIVTPYDDSHHYLNSTCPQCHTLQYYMLDVTKYFTSNTQLLFLPGEHHLNTDLTIKDVHNISLIGNFASNRRSIIKILKNAAIKVFNSSMVTVKNFGIASRNISFLCITNISLHNIIINGVIIGHNIVGESVLFNITSNELNITNDDDISMESLNSHKLSIFNSTIRELQMEQTFYGMSIFITDSIFSMWEGKIRVFLTSSCTTHQVKEITINNVRFFNNDVLDNMINIEFRLHNDNCLNGTVSTHDKVFINNRLFANNIMFANVYGQWHSKVGKIQQIIIITKCEFVNNLLGGNILLFHSYYTKIDNAVYINDSKFLFNDCKLADLIRMYNVKMQLEGPIKFYNNVFKSLFNLKKGSFILFHDYIELQQNKGTHMIYASKVFIM